MSILIGVIGGSGSGKTTFINKVKQDYKAEDICIISQDNYYKPLAMQQRDENDVANFDIPEAIYLDRLIADIKQLKAGKQIELQEYTFNNDKSKSSKIILKPAPIIIVEGIFIFYSEELRELFDLKIYFHTHENLKLIRRLKRDQVERNYPVDDVLYRYEHHVIPCFKKYVEPYLDNADIIINNFKHFEKAYAVVSGYLSHTLVKLLKTT